MKRDTTDNITTKIVIIGLVSLIVNIGLVACSRTAFTPAPETEPESQISIVDVSYDEIDNAAVTTGGWKTAESTDITPEQLEVFNKAMEKLVGVKYEPVAYLGSQLVSGTNHCFLCKATVVVPKATPRYTLVYIYEKLNKECEILNIVDLAATGKENGEAVLGGWSFSKDPSITPAISAAVSKASAKKLGATYEPVANIASQIVSGTNHAILCKVKAVTPDAESHYALVFIYESLDGNCSITEVTDIVLSADR